MGDAEEELDFDTSKEVSVTSTFDAMGLREDLLRGLYAYGGRPPPTVHNHPSAMP
jgi:ATP-dependent RNA helicase